MTTPALIEVEPRDYFITTVALQPDRRTRIENSGPLTLAEAQKMRTERLAQNPEDWQIIRFKGDA